MRNAHIYHRARKYLRKEWLAERRGDHIMAMKYCRLYDKYRILDKSYKSY